MLGPLLFVLYINDISEFIQSQLGVFADDTKLSEVFVMQLDCRETDNMQGWSRFCLLNLNLEKCKVMHIGKTLGTNYTMGTSTSGGGSS